MKRFAYCLIVGLLAVVFTFGCGSRGIRPNDLSEKETEAMLNLLVRAYTNNLDLAMRENFYTETYLFDPIAMEAYRSKGRSGDAPAKLDKPLVTLSAIVKYHSQQEIEDAKAKISRALQSSSITWEDNGKPIQVRITQFEFLYEHDAVPAGSFTSLDKFTVIPRRVEVK